MPVEANCSVWPARRATRLDVLLLLREDERDADAAATRAAGAADAVHVPVVLLGRIEVDDMGDLDEVEAPGRDIGRDERRGMADPRTA